MTDARELAIAAMAKVSGFDVVIVCTGDDMQVGDHLPARSVTQHELRCGSPSPRVSAFEIATRLALF